MISGLRRINNAFPRGGGVRTVTRLKKHLTKTVKSAITYLSDYTDKGKGAIRRYSW